MTWNNFLIVLKVLFLILCTYSISAQEDVKKDKKHGFLLSYNYAPPQFFGKHVNNIAHGKWTGSEFSIGISVFKKLDILYYYSRSRAEVTDRSYVNTSSSKFSAGGFILRYVVPLYKKFTLYPRLKIGTTTLKNQGSVKGGNLSLGASVSYSILKKIHLKAGCHIDEYSYAIMTSPSLKQHYKNAWAFVPTIGIEFNTSQ